MKKKLQLINLGLMLTVLFAVCYQSLHAFSHSIKQESEHYHTHSESSKNLVYKISEKEGCPVCDFKFVAFLSPSTFHFTFNPPFHTIPYQFKNNEISAEFKGNASYLRGPPFLI